MSISVKGKPAVFYLALALVLLNAVTAIVYVAGYHGSRYMSWLAFAVAATVAAVGIVLFFLGKMRYYAAVSFVGSLIAVGSFVLGVFDYLVDAFVGIDVTSLSAEFIGCAVLFVLTLAVSFLANMMRTE